MKKAIYKAMYRDFKENGIVKGSIFKIWYELEFVRCNGFDMIKDYLIILTHKLQAKN